MFCFVNISQVIGREGWWVFCISQETDREDDHQNVL